MKNTIKDQPYVTYDTIPILVSRVGDEDKWMEAEVRSGEYVGTDELVHVGESLYLNHDQCLKVFGEPYPLGSSNGGDITDYLRKGAVIRLNTKGSMIRTWQSIADSDVYSTESYPATDDSSWVDETYEPRETLCQTVQPHA
jgi:hypothetical protein